MKLMLAALAGLGAIGLACTAIAQPAPTWSSVGPVFAQNCSGCHGGSSPRAGLNLTSFAGLTAGSNNGPVVVCGMSADSLLMKRITGEIMPQMPRGGTPLTTEVIASIAAWIDAGCLEA